MSNYIPSPLDTSSCQLSEELSALVEQLAKNTHEVWAQQRIEDGWEYGAERNDKQKQHPCLVPYEELPESEKSYDRNVVTQLLKGVVCLGYNIVPAQK